MDHTEPEEIVTYRPRHNVHISNVIGSEVNYGLFSIKNDRVSSLLANDDGYDADPNVPNLEMLRDWTEQHRTNEMKEFGVSEWEPDLAF